MFICNYISTINQVGDIIISHFKRLNNVKDTGKIIPGHGGILIELMYDIFISIFLFNLLIYYKFLMKNSLFGFTGSMKL